MESVNPVEFTAIESPLQMLLTAVSLIPISHHLLGFSFILIVFLYKFLEIHFLQDLFAGFRGQPVVLTFDPCSQLYRDVVSKCKILHGRYQKQCYLWINSLVLLSVFEQFVFVLRLTLITALLFFFSDFLCAAEIRYLSTPWLCSPHLQTTFIHYFGNPPAVGYRR